MKTKEKSLRGLKTAKRKLEKIYSRNQFFESVYMKTGKRRLLEKKDVKQLVINDDEIKDIFSTVPKETIEYLVSKYESDFFDMKKKSISIETYADLIQSIKFLIEIIEFDLVGAFADKLYRKTDLLELDTDLKETKRNMPSGKPYRRTRLKEGGYYKSPYDPSPRAQYYDNPMDIVRDYSKGIIGYEGVEDIAEHFGWEENPRIRGILDEFVDEDDDCEDDGGKCPGCGAKYLRDCRC